MVRSVEAMVSEQVARWRQEEVVDGPGRGACVAFSHLPGSGAAELGRRVAERLGYGFFDREIVESIARDSGAQLRLVGELDEHVRSMIDRYVVDVFRGRSFAEDDYLKSVGRVFATLAKCGRAVLLGRGAGESPPGARR